MGLIHKHMETIQVGSTTIELVRDTDPINPREHDFHLGEMICFHRRYTLGDKHKYTSDMFSGWADMRKKLEKTHIMLPLFLYDHGGITISTTHFNCPWDSGQVGYIAASKDKVRSEYNVKAITPAIRKKVIQVLLGEVDEYDKYITGEVYGYRIFRDGEEIDSCWGFYGLDACRNEAMMNINIQTA